MTEFDLLKIGSKPDPLTGKVSFTESIQFKVSMGIAIAAVLSIFTLDMMNFDVPEWLNFFISMGSVIGYTFAFMALLFSHNAGKVYFSSNKIVIDPKKDTEEFPDSPIQINPESHIKISVIQSARFPINRTLLHFQIVKGNTESDFGMLLKNKQKHQQYYDLLDRWYRAGFNVKEFDQLGSRVFKLKEGKSYSEIQNIKQEYGIEW